MSTLHVLGGRAISVRIPLYATREAGAVLAAEEKSRRFAEFYTEHARRIHRYLARRIGADLADDLTADVFTVAYARWDTFDPDRGEALAWLYGIAGNLLHRHRRREVAMYRALARHGVDPLADDGVEPRAVERLQAAAVSREMAGALARLKAEDRDILLLVAWEDLSYEQVAQALDIPVARVRSRLHETRKKLRSERNGGR